MTAFKDTFWTVTSQPNPYNFTELNPELNVLVASLSMSGVAIGDGINYTNKTLAMKTCMQDGTLFRTDRPITTIDECFLATNSPRRPQGEVWSTFTMVGSFKVYHILAANLTKPYILYPHTLGILADSSYYIFEFERETSSLAPFSEANPLIIPACPAKYDYVPFHYYLAVPSQNSDWVFLGEVQKFITISRQRFHQLSVSQQSFQVQVRGFYQEKVELVLFFKPSKQQFRVTCLFNNSNKPLLTLLCTSSTTPQCSCQ